MMMVHRLALAILLTLAATSTRSVDAHGKLLKPEARIRPDSGVSEGQQNYFAGEIDGKKVFSENQNQNNGDGASGGNNKLQWGRSAEQNQRQFADLFAAAGYTSLRQFFKANEQLMVPRFRGKTDNVCGYTDAAAAPSKLPADGIIEWGNKAAQWGFQDDHHGPCEVWCDDNLVMQHKNCRAEYGRELPARIPIDVARCSGATRLQFLWLALHAAKWQYWLNCVPLTPTATLPPAANASAPLAPLAPLALPSVPPALAPASRVPQAQMQAAAVTTAAPPAVPLAVPVVATTLTPGYGPTPTVVAPPTTKTSLGSSPQRQGNAIVNPDVDADVGKDADVGSSVTTTPSSTAAAAGTAGVPSSGWLQSFLSRARFPGTEAA